MSWLNLNNLSNIKGQISSFASGVLAEGIIGDNTEPSEPDNENLQITIAALKDEIEKLKEENLQYQKQNFPNKKNVEIDEDNDDGWSWDSPVPNLVDKNLVTELRKKNADLETEKRELFNSLEQLDLEHKEATEQLILIKNNLQKENNKLKQEHEEIKKKNEFLLKINEETQKKLDSFEKLQNKPSMEEICLTKNENIENACLNNQELLSRHKVELEDKILKLEEEVLILERENSNLKLKKEEYSENFNSIILQKDTKISELENKIHNLPSDLQKQYMKTLHENLDNINNFDIGDDSNFIQNILKLISNYKIKCDDLEAQLSSFNNKKNEDTNKILREHEEVTKELLNSQEELSRFKTEYKVLSEKLQANREELEQFKQNSGDKLKELSFNNHEFERLKTKCQVVSAELSTKADELKVVNTKYEELLEELTNKKINFECVRIENTQLSQELSSNKKELEEINSENKELSNELSRNQQELNMFKIENEELLKELSNKEQELKHFKNECEELSKNNDALIERIQENTNLLPISENNEDSLLELEQQVDVANKQILELETIIENSKIVTDVDDLKKHLGQTGNELDKTKQQYENLKSDYKQLKEDYSHLKTNLADMKLTYDVCYNEKEDLNSAVDQIKIDYENTEYKYAEQNINMETLNEEIETHLKDIEKLREENKNLIILNEDANVKMELSQKEIEDLKQELTSVLEGLEEKEEEIKKLNEILISCNDSESLVLNLKNKIEELNTNEKDLLSQLNDNKALLENVEKEKNVLDELYKSINSQVENLKLENASVVTVMTDLTNEKSILDDSLSQMKKLIFEKHQENINYHEEIKRLQQALAEQFEKSQSYQVQLQNLHDTLPNKEDLDRKIQQIETLSEQNAFLNEKCKKLTDILVQEQGKVTKLMAENSSVSDKEIILEKKLEKLRQHLLEMENSYTEEIQKTEEKYEDMKLKLQQVEEREKNSSNRYTSVNIRANQQVETLQTQLQLVTNQRDELRTKVSELEDEIAKKNAALVNLQIVLQQFQREKEVDIHNETERIRRQITLEKDKQAGLQKEINELKSQLEESKEALKAATRLSEQVNVYKEQVNLLKIEVESLQQKLKKSEQQCSNLISRTDAKVDKLLIKNLIIGFLSSNNYACNQDQNQILKIISSVLDFNQNDMEKAKMNAQTQNSWLNALLHPKVPESDNKNQESLAQAFVKFLEEESKPKNLPNLLDATSTAKQETAPNNEATNKRQSPIVLNEIVLPTFADFGRNRNSSSILKDVLKDNT